MGVCVLVMFDSKNTIDELFEQSVQSAKTTQIINDGDLVVITAGVPLKTFQEPQISLRYTR
jgi:pyruvate kinase